MFIILKQWKLPKCISVEDFTQIVVHPYKYSITLKENEKTPYAQYEKIAEEYCVMKKDRDGDQPDRIRIGDLPLNSCYTFQFFEPWNYITYSKKFRTEKDGLKGQ